MILSNDNLISLINIFSKSFENNIISKLTLSSVNNILSEKINIIEYFDINELEAVFIKPFESKNQLKLSFVFRYPKKDITKNFDLVQATEILKSLMGIYFLQADLFLDSKSHHLIFHKNGRSTFIVKNLVETRQLDLSHNKTKNRMVATANYLKLLGVESQEGKIKSDKKDKYIQINKFLEFFAQTLKESTLSDDFKIVDMGSGKGYLTFAMYDYVANILQKNVEVQGIEFRQDMVDLCNGFADQAKFENLKFVKGSIEKAEIGEPNVLIALHACDIATDEAIFKGISTGAKIIMLSPCCHKQVRKDMKSMDTIDLITKNGILKERLAEMLTDSIRALILEVYGYKTKVFEFINSDHSPKNLMITAVKKSNGKILNQDKLKEILVLKEMFGLKQHHLEKLMGI